MNQLHQLEEATKFSDFFKANSDVFIRFSTLIQIAMRVIITPFMSDFRIQSTSFSSEETKQTDYHMQPS